MIIGSGAREHALAWKLGAEGGVDDVLCVPGNPGMARTARIAACDQSDPGALAALAARERIDLTIVGPELPLDRGVVDCFRESGQRIFGPPRAADSPSRLWIACPPRAQRSLRFL